MLCLDLRLLILRPYSRPSKQLKAFKGFLAEASLGSVQQPSSTFLKENIGCFLLLLSATQVAVDNSIGTMDHLGFSTSYYPFKVWYNHANIVEVTIEQMTLVRRIYLEVSPCTKPKKSSVLCDLFFFLFLNLRLNLLQSLLLFGKSKNIRQGSLLGQCHGALILLRP